MQAVLLVYVLLMDTLRCLVILAYVIIYNLSAVQLSTN